MYDSLDEQQCCALMHGYLRTIFFSNDAGELTTNKRATKKGDMTITDRPHKTKVQGRDAPVEQHRPLSSATV